MIFGAITNSWRLQLDGEDLAVLVKEAQTRGARHIELRQTCLGQCESGEGEHWRPVMSRLEALVQAFPGLSFDLAMAWPCLTSTTDPSGSSSRRRCWGRSWSGGRHRTCVLSIPLLSITPGRGLKTYRGRPWVWPIWPVRQPGRGSSSRWRTRVNLFAAWPC